MPQNDFNLGIIKEFRENGGETFGPFKGRNLLLLTTKGAKSGAEGTTPLVYSKDGDRYVVIASMGGAPKSPAWYHNIVANPNVRIEVDGKAYDATATVVDEVERRRLYDAHTAIFPGFAEYEARTGGRVIPVIVLHKVAAQAVA
jgi:deazaflavin-dependent oxidoreductase (nitroreductase family)